MVFNSLYLKLFVLFFFTLCTKEQSIHKNDDIPKVKGNVEDNKVENQKSIDDIIKNPDLLNEVEIITQKPSKRYYIMPTVSLGIMSFPLILDNGLNIKSRLKWLIVDEDPKNQFSRFVLKFLKNSHVSLLFSRQINHGHFSVGFGPRIGISEFSRSCSNKTDTGEGEGGADMNKKKNVCFEYLQIMGMLNLSFYSDPVDIMSKFFISLNIGGGIISGINPFKSSLPWNNIEYDINVHESIIKKKGIIDEDGTLYPWIAFGEIIIGYNKIGGFIRCCSPLFTKKDYKFKEKKKTDTSIEVNFEKMLYVPIEVGVFINLG